MKNPYEQYFGLAKAPFNTTPDADFLYLSASHREALAQLSYGVSARKGFLVLTGEVGTGKTTLLRALLHELGAGTQTALIFGVITNGVDLLRSVCEEFGLIQTEQHGLEAHDYLVMLNNFLLRNFRSGTNCALIIDEAQNLSSDVLENVRLLSNFETPKDKLLQIVLAGQPELAQRLNSKDLRQLKQRITLRHHLNGLSSAEVHEYIITRMTKAGGEPAVFTPEAFESICRYSGGIPRLVNILCDNALLTAFALDQKQIDQNIIREIADDLQIIQEPSPPHKKLRRNEKFMNPDGLDRLIHAASGTSINKRIDDVSWLARPILDDEPAAFSINHSPDGIFEESRENVAGAYLDDDFFQFLVGELTEAMGPMARFVVIDRMMSLGESRDRFPVAKLKRLLDSLSSEILDQSMQQKFQKSLAKHVRTSNGRT